MNESQTAQTRYWAQTERLRKSLLPKVRKIYKIALWKQIEPVMANINQNTAPDQSIDSAERLIKEGPMLKAMEAAYIAVGLPFAKRSRRYVKSDQAPETTKDEFQDLLDLLEDQWTADIIAFVNGALLGERITAITGESKQRAIKIMRASFEAATEEGLGIAEISIRMRADLKKSWGSMVKYRADRIARTELISASNRGSIQGVISTGLDMLKYWISTPDSDTRQGEFDHVTPGAQSETVELKDPFILTGEALQYPGDPSGSAGNVINCRCTQAYISRERYAEEQQN